MSENQVKFQNLLRNLFQFECADVDFGIYHIMNNKRAVIEQFIAEELERGALAEQSQAAQALESARKNVLETLGNDALDADGNLAESFRSTPAGKEYLAARETPAGARSLDGLFKARMFANVEA
jgi:adenine-specific DNA-methyltransferase